MLAAGILFTLLLSALFSGSEIAFVSANKLKIELKKKRGTYRSLLIGNFYEKPANFLSTMLVGNTIALVLFSMLITIPLESVLTAAFGIQNEGVLLFIGIIIITLVVLVFGEFVPKALFRLYADDVLYLLAMPLRTLQVILHVPSWVMTRSSDLLLRLFFRQPADQIETTFTRLDLENFIMQTSTEAEESINTELFGKALNLYDVRVRDCMVPRTEIEYLNVDASLAELEELFRETRLSRILITGDDVNNVLGYVHHQQLLKHPKDIRGLILDLPYVPEVMRVTDLMNKFIVEKLNIACVVDEFGGVSGLITLEDILEEIFGEIEDEYDEDDEYIELEEKDGVYLFSGRLEVDYLNEKYSLNLPETEYHTLSGYLVSHTASIPEQGDVLEVGGYRFEVTQVSNTRVETVRVIRIPLEEDAKSS